MSAVEDGATCPKCVVARHPECWRQTGHACVCQCTEIEVGTRVTVKDHVPSLEGMATVHGVVTARSEFLADVRTDHDSVAKTYGLGALTVTRTWPEGWKGV